MRPFSSAPIRRALAAALSVTASAVVLAAPASANPAMAPDPANSVVVSRLSISDGKGWLTLHARNNTAIGYEVRIPAGNGSWSGKADVYMPEQDAHCRLQSGPDLHYICRPGEYGFPSGNYAVSIPVTRTGSVEGLTGRAWAFADTSAWYEDTFPVLDGSHYRSTTEVRNAPFTRDAGEAEGRASLSVTTTVVPGESIEAVDVTIPAGSWRLIGSNAGNHGVRCNVLDPGTGSPTLHCRPDAAPASGLTAGRYHLVLTLGFRGEPKRQYSEVSLAAAGHSPEVQDTFAWVNR